MIIICIGLLPENGVLRDPTNSSITNSPFIKGIVVIIALYAGIAGIAFGYASGTFRNSRECIQAMESGLSSMGSYLVLMFFAAQFVSSFNWSNLGTLLAINGADFLKTLQLSNNSLLLGFILLCTSINLLIGSASAKWALLAPIFVPMFYLLGLSPEGVQLAYRIGDSSTNIITPLMPYFGVVLAFAQQHDKETGVGTIMALMLPYSITILISWSILFLLWMNTGWSIGPEAWILLNEK